MSQNKSDYVFKPSSASRAKVSDKPRKSRDQADESVDSHESAGVPPTMYPSMPHGVPPGMNPQMMGMPPGMPPYGFFHPYMMGMPPQMMGMPPQMMGMPPPGPVPTGPAVAAPTVSTAPTAQSNPNDEVLKALQKFDERLNSITADKLKAEEKLRAATEDSAAKARETEELKAKLAEYERNAAAQTTQKVNKSTKKKPTEPVQTVEPAQTEDSVAETKTKTKTEPTKNKVNKSIKKKESQETTNSVVPDAAAAAASTTSNEPTPMVRGKKSLNFKSALTGKKDEVEDVAESKPESKPKAPSSKASSSKADSAKKMDPVEYRKMMKEKVITGRDAYETHIKNVIDSAIPEMEGKGENYYHMIHADLRTFDGYKTWHYGPQKEGIHNRHFYIANKISMAFYNAQLYAASKGFKLLDLSDPSKNRKGHDNFFIVLANPKFEFEQEKKEIWHKFNYMSRRAKLELKKALGEAEEEAEEDSDEEEANADAGADDGADADTDDNGSQADASDADA